MRKLVLAGLLVGLTLLPGAAAADTLTFTGLGSGTWVTLNLGGQVETGWAGEINWVAKTPTNGAGAAFQTFCADLFDDARLPVQSGTLESSSALDKSIANNASISLNALPHAGAMAAYLVTTDGATAHGSDTKAAGLQIAIWQAMFGKNSFTYNASSPDVQKAADGFYNGLTAALSSNAAGVFGTTALYFDVNNSLTQSGAYANGQDQIGTPEPAPILLVLLAVAAMVSYQRYSKPRLAPSATRVFWN